jgi:hypothetical protein
MPTPAAGQRRRGSPEAATAQAAAGGRQNATSGEARDVAGEPDAAGAGAGTTPQDSAASPLGIATELPVTLEEVLLATREGVEPTERRSRPSRRAEDLGATIPAAGGAAAGAGSPELEKPALHVPYPARARQLVREFFAPAPADRSTEPTSQESTG